MCFRWHRYWNRDFDAHLHHGYFSNCFLLPCEHYVLTLYRSCHKSDIKQLFCVNIEINRLTATHWVFSHARSREMLWSWFSTLTYKLFLRNNFKYTIVLHFCTVLSLSIHHVAYVVEQIYGNVIKLIMCKFREDKDSNWSSPRAKRRNMKCLHGCTEQVGNIYDRF
jgi:hypothetical protein